MNSFTRKITKSIPYVGNLVKTCYMIGNPDSGYPYRKMPCYTVRLDELSALPALIVSNTELREAKLRYMKNVDKLSGSIRDDLRSKPGHMRSVNVVLDSNRTTVEYKFVYFDSEDPIYGNSGYMFSKSEMDDIGDRTARIPDTVRKPGLIQKLFIWLFKLEGDRSE